MKEAIKEFILGKAKEVFEEKGYKNTSMQDLAAAAKISKPTLYKYFPGKMELFFTVLDTLQKEIDNKILPVLVQDMELMDKVSAMITSSIKFGIENKKIFRVVMFESMTVAFSDREARSDDMMPILEKTHQQFFERKDRGQKALENVIAQGQKEGVIRNDMESSLIATLIVGIIKEVILEVISNPEEIPDLEKISNSIFKLISGGILKGSGGY